VAGGLGFQHISDRGNADHAAVARSLSKVFSFDETKVVFASSSSPVLADDLQRQQKLYLYESLIKNHKRALSGRYVSVAGIDAMFNAIESLGGDELEDFYVIADIPEFDKPYIYGRRVPKSEHGSELRTIILDYLHAKVNSIQNGIVGEKKLKIYSPSYGDELIQEKVSSRKMVLFSKIVFPDTKRERILDRSGLGADLELFHLPSEKTHHAPDGKLTFKENELFVGVDAGRRNLKLVLYNGLGDIITVKERPWVLERKNEKSFDPSLINNPQLHMDVLARSVQELIVSSKGLLQQGNKIPFADFTIKGIGFSLAAPVLRGEIKPISGILKGLLDSGFLSADDPFEDYFEKLRNDLKHRGLNVADDVRSLVVNDGHAQAMFNVYERFRQNQTQRDGLAIHLSLGSTTTGALEVDGEVSPLLCEFSQVVQGFAKGNNDGFLAAYTPAEASDGSIKTFVYQLQKNIHTRGPFHGLKINKNLFNLFAQHDALLKVQMYYRTLLSKENELSFLEQEDKDRIAGIFRSCGNVFARFLLTFADYHRQKKCTVYVGGKLLSKETGRIFIEEASRTINSSRSTLGKQSGHDVVIVPFWMSLEGGKNKNITALDDKDMYAQAMGVAESVRYKAGGEFLARSLRAKIKLPLGIVKPDEFSYNVIKKVLMTDNVLPHQVERTFLGADGTNVVYLEKYRFDSSSHIKTLSIARRICQAETYSQWNDERSNQFNAKRVYKGLCERDPDDGLFDYLTHFYYYNDTPSSGGLYEVAQQYLHDSMNFDEIDRSTVISEEEKEAIALKIWDHAVSFLKHTDYVINDINKPSNIMYSFAKKRVYFHDTDVMRYKFEKNAISEHDFLMSVYWVVEKYIKDVPRVAAVIDDIVGGPPPVGRSNVVNNDYVDATWITGNVEVKESSLYRGERFPEFFTHIAAKIMPVFEALAARGDQTKNEMWKKSHDGAYRVTFTAYAFSEVPVKGYLVSNDGDSMEDDEVRLFYNQRYFMYRHDADFMAYMAYLTFYESVLAIKNLRRTDLNAYVAEYVARSGDGLAEALVRFEKDREKYPALSEGFWRYFAETVRPLRLHASRFDDNAKNGGVDFSHVLPAEVSFALPGSWTATRDDIPDIGSMSFAIMQRTDSLSVESVLGVS
jgi:hypothetical protein